MIALLAVSGICFVLVLMVTLSVLDLVNSKFIKWQMRHEQPENYFSQRVVQNGLARVEKRRKKKA